MDTQPLANDFEILPELEKCLPTITELHLKRLVESLRKDGMIHGITLCTIDELPGRRFVLDGHTRLRIAKYHEIAWKVDTDEILNFATVAEAAQWVCEFQASRRNLTSEQFTQLLGRYYNLEKQKVGANQHSATREDQIDPGSSGAEKAAKAFGVGTATVKRAGKKAENLEKVGLDSAVQDRTITHISTPVLAEIAASVEANPEQKEEIVKEVLEEAKANGGRVTGRKKAETPEPVADDEAEREDPARERALEDLSEQISDLIFDARKRWNADFVARLKRNVLEAFKKRLPEVSKAPLQQPAPVMPAPMPVA